MDVVRRLGLIDRITPSDITFLTAGGSSEKPEGVLTALPIRIGRLELKIDTMVTPAQNYNILVGNDWLRMAGADLLLSKSILYIRLGAEQWEDVPIDAEITPRRLNTFLRQFPSTSQTPQQAILAAVAREAESSTIRQSSIREEDESWRLYPELPIITITRPGMLAASVKYDMRECKAFANFPRAFCVG